MERPGTLVGPLGTPPSAATWEAPGHGFSRPCRLQDPGVRRRACAEEEPAQAEEPEEEPAQEQAPEKVQEHVEFTNGVFHFEVEEPSLIQ